MDATRLGRSCHFLSLREGGARFATANLADPHAVLFNAFGVTVASQSLADHVEVCKTTRAGAPGVDFNSPRMEANDQWNQKSR